MLLLPIAAAGQSCEYYLPYSQNFNQSFDLENGYFNPLYDTTLVFYDNCWKQILYRTTGRWPFVGRPPREDYDNFALRLYADHPFEGNDRVEYTYMLSPFFRNTPFVISFDYCNLIISPETDDEGVWIDLTSERTGSFQVGYVSDTNQPESSYHAITTIVMDPAEGATNRMQHFRIDLETLYGTVPHIEQIAFKMLTDMTGVKYTNIYIDNFRVSSGIDSTIVNYRDTVCPGASYSGYGFTIDSTETVTPGLHTFVREEMVESHLKVVYHLLLWVEEPVTTHVDATLTLGDTLQFLDSLIVDTGDYVSSLTSMRGCDSMVVLHVERQEVVLSVSSQHVCPGEEVILTVSGVHTFRWASIPSDPLLESQQGRNTVAVHPMEYTVYQVLDAEGVLLAAIDVGMESCEGLWFPNAFTPDAETNNRFVIQTSLPVEEFEMTVYTRNGLLVWHSEDINQMWDGTRNGTPLPQGAYVYHWRLKSNNRVRSGLGTITLLR